MTEETHADSSATSIRKPTTPRAGARHGVRAALVIAAVSAVTAFGTWHELDDLLELGVDTYARFARPIDGSAVALVRITNDDYRDMFGGESPLDPVRLQA